MKRKIQIGVIGPSKINYPNNPQLAKILDETAEKLGKEIAKKNAILFTGGCDGIMEASSKGAKKERGITIGTPGSQRGDSNNFIDIEIISPINIGNFLFSGILSCDIIIVIGESAGTTAELALAYRNKIPIIIIEGFSEYYDNLIGKYLDNKKCITRSLAVRTAG